MRRRRLVVLCMSALLGAGALSGCDEQIEPNRVDANKSAVEAADDDTLEGEDPAEIDVEEAPEPDDPADEGEGAVDTLDPDDSAARDGTDPASSESNGSGGVLYEALPTTLCPIDIPAPFTPHHMDSEEPGDGNEIFCIAHVSSKGDPVYLYEDITEQFKGIDAAQVEDVPAVDPYDPSDISIQTWLVQDHEIIVNMRYVGPTGVELIYVVRTPR